MLKNAFVNYLGVALALWERCEHFIHTVELGRGYMAQLVGAKRAVLCCHVCGLTVLTPLFLVILYFCLGGWVGISFMTNKMKM